MNELGFWKQAEAHPETVAVIDPDGAETKASELLSAANQVAHGLSALGLRPGDAVAMALPNSAAVFELFMAVAQSGLYLVPINWHLTGPEIAYILRDSEAKVFVGAERLAEVCVSAARAAELTPERRFAIGEVP